MGKLFDFFRFSSRRETTGTEAISSSQRLTGGTISRRTVRIGENPEKAMCISAVYAAVRILSDAAGQLPIKYKRYNASTGAFVDYNTGTGAPLYYALTVRPNDRLTSFHFFKTIVQDMLLYGNAYALPFKNEMGQVTGFDLLRPSDVVFDKYSNTYSVHDLINGINGNFTADRILHFKNISVDGGYTGVSTLRYAALHLNIAATAGSETLDTFSTGGGGKFLFHDDHTIAGYGAPQDKELLKAGTDIQDQLDEGNDVIVVRGSGALDPLSISAADLQFLEREKLNIVDIARFFGVHPTKLYQEINSNYKSTDAANVAFYSESLRPLFTNIENELTVKLISPDKYGKYKFVYDTEALYTTDLLTRADYYAKMIANGMLTSNEGRLKMDMPPVEGGDVALISTNMAAINSAKISEPAEQATEPTTEQDTEPETEPQNKRKKRATKKG